MKLNIKTIALLLFICGCFLKQPVLGQVRLPRLVSDSMVLQRDAAVKIWGWASVGEKVTISFRDKIYHTTTGNDGNWMVVLPAMKAGGPYDMIIDATNHIVLKNIMLGDVWVCSGQSNMELPMERVKDKYAGVIATATNPYIRQFNVSTRYVFQSPQQDVPTGAWESATPQSVLRFTAVGYFFARTLYEKYHVPIGLIKSCVGGTPAEAWISEDALQAFPAYLATAQRFKDSLYVDSLKNTNQAITNAWDNLIKQQDLGLKDAKPWFDQAYAPLEWSTMQLPGFWDDQGLKGVNGVVWFRKEINVPPSMTGKPAKLLMGRIVDADYIYVNGTFSGTTSYQYPPRRYELPANILRPGTNTIVIRVINNTGRGGFVTDKPYQLTAGSDTIDLKGEWQYKVGAIVTPLRGLTIPPQYQPLGLYNGMIAPLINYAIRGVIWYQGEANTSKAAEYRQLFPALINNWRQKWNQGTFPFLYVQLANFMDVKKQPSESNWAALREAQRRTLAVPNTGMAVIVDIGEWNDIHPLNKQDVGKRLALAAQKRTYGDGKVVWSGPLYQSMKIKDDKIIITFTSTGSGLMAANGEDLKYFAIAGADKTFVWAKAKIEGDKVIVWNDQIPHPVTVRYAWADNPAGANLYNKEGLPASPFTTDKDLY